MADYYELLGVSKNASEDEIKRAYRKLARELHPDSTGGDKDAAEKFKEVSAAFDVLKDPEKRRQYDMYGERAAAGSPFGQGDPFGPNFGDIFENIFGSAFGTGFGGGGGARAQRAGEDREIRVALTFEESIFGAKKEVSLRLPVVCTTCTGTGSKPGTLPSTCPACGGRGQVQRVSQTILGRMVTTTACDRCNGEGRIITTPCPDCRGEGRRTEERRYLVDLQPGIEDGSILRLAGKGAVGPRGGYPGNLYVHISVSPSERFVKDGMELRAAQSVSFAQAALGTTLDFETLDGLVEIVVEPGTQSGKVVRIKGKGVPHANGRGRGDMLVEIIVETPKELTEDEAALLYQLAQLRGERITPPADAGLFSKLKSAFR